MIKNVIFDLDGTLLDTSEGIIEGVMHAIQVLGYKELSREKLLTFIGPPVQASFMKNFGCDEKAAQEATKIFRDYYVNKSLLKAKPYDGIYELCHTLRAKGLKMAVATYKREDCAVKLLKHYKFDEYCYPMHGADNNNLLKKEDIINMCISEMGGSHENSVLIGDTFHDALGAERAGISFIAVTYGFGFKSPEDAAQYPNIGTAKTPLDAADIVLKAPQ